MSRIGRQPIPLPAGVTVSIEPESVRVNGPKGELSERVNRDIEVVQEGEQVLVRRPTDRGEHRALHGLTRTLVANMVAGRHRGLSRSAWRSRASATGRRSKARTSSWPSATPTRFRSRLRRGSNSRSPSRPAIVVKGISKQLVGETAAIIRKQRPPEPYKGKGIRYEGEHVPRKVGKRA